MRTSSVGFVLLAALVLPSRAEASALYFAKVLVRTSSERTCLRFAEDTARGEGFRNVHKNALEVAGEKDGAYVSITCVGRRDWPAMAIVMSVADSFATAKRVADQSAEHIKRISCFDSPC